MKNKRLSGICEYLEYVLDDNKEAFETSAKEMQFLEKQYNEGSRSPFLYLQACVLPRKMGHCFADLVDLQDRLCCLQNVMESFQKRWHFVQQIYRKTFESIRNLSMSCWNIFIRDIRPPRLCVQLPFDYERKSGRRTVFQMV